METHSKRLFREELSVLSAPPLAVEATYSRSTKPSWQSADYQVIQLQSGWDLNANHPAGALPASELNSFVSPYGGRLHGIFWGHLRAALRTLLTTGI